MDGKTADEMVACSVEVLDDCLAEKKAVCSAACSEYSMVEQKAALLVVQKVELKDGKSVAMMVAMLVA